MTEDIGQSTQRRYDIDALRVIALALLIIYHIFVAYQPFASAIQFIQYDQLLTEYWFVAEIFNIWRIPVLFLISGMAVGFILGRRTIKEVLVDRMMRLVPPLVFGSLVFCPAYVALQAVYLEKAPTFEFTPGHLWFVWSLVTYAILLLPLILYFKRRPDNLITRALRATFPFGLLVFLPLPLVLETVLSEPWEFAFFPVRFWYGLLCYASGFLLVSVGDKFWASLTKVCHVALPLAFLLYLGRTGYLEWEALQANHWTTAFESGMWMLVFLGYGALFLNRPTKAFAYLNKAVFPIYIIHMVVQQGVALVIFPWGLAPSATFFLHVLFTLALCCLVYEFVIRRARWLYPVMGLKIAKAQTNQVFPPKKLARWGRGLTLFVLSPLVVLAQLGILAAVAAGHFLGELTPDAGPSDSLWSAAKNNDVQNLEKFLEAGETPVDQLAPSINLSSLHLAALNGSTEAVKALIGAGADVNLRAEDQSTALSHAALMGHPEIVELLLKGKAEVNPVNVYQSTPLDNTYAPWEIVLSVSGLLELQVDREKWEKGRTEVRNLLLANGGKHRKALD